MKWSFVTVLLLEKSCRMEVSIEEIFAHETVKGS